MTKADSAPTLAYAKTTLTPPWLTTRLSIMMFLEFAIWGVWAVIVSGHMRYLGFSATEQGYVYLTTALGAMLSPFIAGWVADRFLPNQIFTGAVHLAGAALLAVAFFQRNFLGLWTVVLCYAVLYMPTIATTNAIAFHHMKDAKKFGLIRVWGTIGWIVINFAFSEYLRRWELTGVGGSEPHQGDCLAAAAGLSVLMGLYCFTLPNTPPSKQSKNPYAFLEAVKLCANRNFAVLLVISFIVAIELPFYYNLGYLFLTDANTGIGLQNSVAQKALLLGQLAEIATMILLAPALKHLGMRTTILLGILAWPIRYGIFALGHPAWLVITAQALHGVCYSFFFAAGMIAVERLCQKDIRASAQGLMVFATYGLGMLIGSLIEGHTADYFKVEGGHNWTAIFLVPVGITIVAGIAFAALFRERSYVTDSTKIEQETLAAR